MKTKAVLGSEVTTPLMDDLYDTMTLREKNRPVCSAGDALKTLPRQTDRQTDLYNVLSNNADEARKNQDK
jgi:hypothetical protein